MISVNGFGTINEALWHPLQQQLENPGMLSLRLFFCLFLTVFLLGGCATEPKLTATHGMAPSSTGPQPDWFVQEFGLPRGVGEALRRDRLALWDNEAGTFTYTIRGEVYAEFHPWEHFLKIKPETDNNTFSKECQWSAEGLLNNTHPNEIRPEVAEHCNKLIHELAQEFNLATE